MYSPLPPSTPPLWKTMFLIINLSPTVQESENNFNYFWYTVKCFNGRKYWHLYKNEISYMLMFSSWYIIHIKKLFLFACSNIISWENSLTNFHWIERLSLDDWKRQSCSFHENTMKPPRRVTGRGQSLICTKMLRADKQQVQVQPWFESHRADHLNCRLRLAGELFLKWVALCFNRAPSYLFS